jgi:glutathione peroxidase
MKEWAFLFFILFSISSSMGQKTFHDFTVKDIDGKDLVLSDFKGKKVLVVNVASKCGFTPQYEGLQKLYQTYGPDEFVIVGFPANDFLWQEPANNEDIKAFCSNEYDVTFPMMSKIVVKGSKKNEVYAWLTKKEQNGVADAKVTWNFQKFLIGENGEWLASFSPKTAPLSEEIVNWLK